MGNLFEIYRKQFLTELAVVAQYRMSIAIWILSLVTEPIVYMTVWTTITKQQGAIDGYTVGDFAAYYITWMLVRHFAVTLSPEALEWRVRQALFTQAGVLADWRNKIDRAQRATGITREVAIDDIRPWIGWARAGPLSPDLEQELPLDRTKVNEAARILLEHIRLHPGTTGRSLKDFESLLAVPNPG